MVISNLKKLIKSIFIKEETFPCIVWDGKMMNYLDLTQTQINNINTAAEYDGWSVTINEENITKKTNSILKRLKQGQKF